MKRLLISFLMLIILFLIINCSKPSDELLFDVVIEKKRPFFFGITNVRLLIKGAFVATAYSDKCTYVTFSVGSPAIPYNGEPHIFIQLPDASIVDLASSDIVHILERKATARRPCRDKFFNQIDQEFMSWPAGAKLFELSSYKFYVNNHTLIGMTVTHHTYFIDKKGNQQPLIPHYGGLPPKIGTSRTNMISVPFNAQEFVNVFGKPNRIIELFSE